MPPPERDLDAFNRSFAIGRENRLVAELLQMEWGLLVSHRSSPRAPPGGKGQNRVWGPENTGSQGIPFLLVKDGLSVSDSTVG